MPAFPSRLTIDLAALAANYNFLKGKVGPACTVAGVVKANGYGLGVRQIAKTLEAQGCSYFFVATPGEAFELRDYTAKPIAVLGGVYPGDESAYLSQNITPVLNSPEDIRSRRYKGTSIWHIDTGMNRLGIRPEDAPALLEEGYAPDILMTHFACADEKYHPLNSAQVDRFSEIAELLPSVPRSICNSSGIFRSVEWHAEMVRPGMALYGLNPTPEDPNPMRPVVTLETRLLQVKRAKARETVGYGATQTLRRDTTLGIVALGYADGFLRAGSSQAFLYWQGRPCPVLGRVSMDLIAIDLTDLHDRGQLPQAGDWIEVIGQHQDADKLATSCGTIGYEILTSLGTRSERIYKAA